MEWMLLPYRRYFEFNGRSRRKEFWLFSLFCMVVSLGIDLATGGAWSHIASGTYAMGTKSNLVSTSLSGLFSLINLIPTLSVTLRRLHDVDRSGWWMLLYFVPVIGWLILLVFFCLDGTYGSNRYGADPKGRGNADVFR